jgi:hypothetical protein
MSDLREVLRQHAGAVEDRAAHVRVAAVHDRVAAVRRRRVVAGAVTVLLLVAVGAGTWALPRDREVAPAGRPDRLVGHAVPKTTTSWGATYSYAKGYAGTGRLTVTLPRSRHDVLVRVASATEDGKLVLSDRTGAWVLPAGGFGTFRRIDPATRTVTVDARGATGPLAVAVYTYSRPASGYTRDGITFPERVETRELLGAFIGRPGEDRGSVRLAAIDWSGPAPSVQVRPLCVGAPAGARVAVDLGDGPLELGCTDDAAPTDAGHAGTALGTTAVARRMTATVRLVDRTGRAIPLPAGGRIGAAIYGWPQEGQPSAGLAATLDQDGHTWRLTGTTVMRGKLARWHRLPVDATAPVLVAYGTTGGSRGYVEARIPGRDPARSSGGGFVYDELTTGDPDARVAVRGLGLAPSARLVLGTYELAD